VIRDLGKFRRTPNLSPLSGFRRRFRGGLGYQGLANLEASFAKAACSSPCKPAPLFALDIPYKSIALWPMLKKRSGWLAALSSAKLSRRTAMGHFEAEIEKARSLRSLSSHNQLGRQLGFSATSIIIRSLALRELSLKKLVVLLAKKRFRKSLWAAFRARWILPDLLWYYLGWRRTKVIRISSPSPFGEPVGVVGFGSVVGSMLPLSWPGSVRSGKPRPLRSWLHSSM